MYDSIKAWTCKLGRVEKLYAFSYQPQQPEREVNGWDIYDARNEWKRFGISDKGIDRGWRISTINTDYGVRLWNSQARRENTLTELVFPNVSSAIACAIFDFGQYPQLCRQISISSTTTRPDVPTFCQQLFNNAEFATFSRGPREPQYPGRKALTLHILDFSHYARFDAIPTSPSKSPVALL